MSGYAFAVAACVALVLFLVVLLRTRRLREKYAVTWLVVGVAVAVFAAFPRAVEALARAVGVQTPSNLVFALALLVLLLVCIQLSVEITSLEEETRTLAEEVALLRLDVERALGAADGGVAPARSRQRTDGTSGAEPDDQTATVEANLAPTGPAQMNPVPVDSAVVEPAQPNPVQADPAEADR